MKVSKHAWPAVPWYKLPDLHTYVAQHLDHEEPGYAKLQRKVLRGVLSGADSTVETDFPPGGEK